jgi:hypothetical protein
MRNRNGKKATYIPIEVVVAHIAGVSTAGDFTAAKRIFESRYEWWYPRSSEPKVTTVWNEWKDGSALSVGQNWTGWVDLPLVMPEIPEPGISTGALQPVSMSQRHAGTRGRRRDIETVMHVALDNGTLSLEALASATERELALQYGGSRTPVREARKAVLAERNSKLDAELSPNFGDGLKDQAAAWA